MHSLLRYYFWITPHVLLAVVLVGFLRRRLQRTLPVFLTYIAFELFQFVVLFLVSCLSSSVTAYRWVLVCGLGISSLLQFGVLYELAEDLLLSHSALASVLRPILRWTAAVLLLIAAIASGKLFAAGVEPVVNVFEIMDFSASVIQVGLVVGLFIFSRALRVSWRSCAAGVALGFGIAGSIELATAALRAELGRGGYVALDVTQMAAHHVCALVWLIYVFLPTRSPALAGQELQTSDLESWNQELQRMVGR